LVVFIAIGLVVLIILALVVALSIGGNNGSSSGNNNGTVSETVREGFEPATQFALRCAACHGPRGSGGITAAPKLAGGAVVRAFPNIDDEVAFVTNGRGAMPAFGKNHGLNAAELRAIVDYTRTL
jgi:mono/diheme cytochrome c family protein